VSLECPVGNLMVNGWGWTLFWVGQKITSTKSSRASLVSLGLGKSQLSQRDGFVKSANKG